MLLYLNEGSVEYIDEIVRRWGRIVVPFFRNYGKSKTAAHGFGSGFVARVRGKHWLVTALHVVDDAIRADACVFSLCGKGVVLEHMAFFPDKANDLAFAPLERILMQHRFARVPAIDLDAEDDGTAEVGYHLLMGYPASKNRLDLKFDELERRLHSVTAERIQHQEDIATNVREPVFFRYDQKAQVDSFFHPLQPPGLHGMSGGPALELRASRFFGNEYRFHIKLSGVLLEWKKQQKVVVAASAVRLRESLRKVEDMQH